MTPVSAITSLPISPPNQPGTADVNRTAADFGKFLTSTLESANNAQLSGDKAVENFATGKARHLHEVMIAAEEADISLRMLVQIRNKALTAYEEIMRMQI